MFGYVEFYFRVENETQIAYCKYNSDFAKPITEEIFNGLKERFKEMYEESGFHVDKIEACTKEEYMKDKSKEMASAQWNDEE